MILTADLSQIDARAVAALRQDPAYLALFRPGVDAHAEIARQVFADPTRREDAKFLTHGYNYGMGRARIAQIAGSEQAARVFLDGMAEQFPRLVEWRRKVAETAASGQLLDNGFGRRMRPHPVVWPFLRRRSDSPRTRPGAR